MEKRQSGREASVEPLLLDAGLEELELGRRQNLFGDRIDADRVRLRPEALAVVPVKRQGRRRLVDKAELGVKAVAVEDGLFVGQEVIGLDAKRRVAHSNQELPLRRDLDAIASAPHRP